jgi:hypothetical protein
VRIAAPFGLAITEAVSCLVPFLARSSTFASRPQLHCHLRIKFEQLFQPLSVVAEPPADTDALKHLVIALVDMASSISTAFIVRVRHLR